MGPKLVLWLWLTSSTWMEARATERGRTPPLGPFPFWNFTLPLEARLDDLVGRLTQAEMISQLSEVECAAIPRLGIGSYRMCVKTAPQAQCLGSLAPPQTGWLCFLNAPCRVFSLSAAAGGGIVTVAPGFRYGACLSGFDDIRNTTAFPSPVTRGASWDVDLERAVASAVASEVLYCTVSGRETFEEKNSFSRIPRS